MSRKSCSVAAAPRHVRESRPLDRLVQAPPLHVAPPEKLKQDALAEAELTVRQARKRADELNMKTESDRHRLEQELEELEETTRQVKERCRELLTHALEAIERSDSLTAPDSEQQELPAPLGHLNDT